MKRGHRVSQRTREALLEVLRELEHGSAYERWYMRRHPDPNRYALRTGRAIARLSTLLDLEPRDGGYTDPPDVATIDREDREQAQLQAEIAERCARREAARTRADTTADPLGDWHGRNE